MADEKYLRHLKRQLKAQRLSAKDQSKQNVNTELAALESAFSEMRIHDIQLSFCAREIMRMHRHAEEMLKSHFTHAEELCKWKITFERCLARQKLDLASRIRALSARADELAKTEGITDLDQALAAVENDYIRLQTSELKTKWDRLRWMLSFTVPGVQDENGQPVQFTVHPPNQDESVVLGDLPKLTFLDKLLCANVKCGRVKASHMHPLCRNCQKRYKEGTLGGEWTGVIPTEPADE